MFTEYFSFVFLPPLQPNYNINFNTSDCLSKITFTVTEVFNTPGELDISKGCSPDLISSSDLRYCRTLLCDPLKVPFKKSLRDGVFPEVIKFGYMVTIHKAGSRKDFANDRAIVID